MRMTIQAMKARNAMKRIAVTICNNLFIIDKRAQIPVVTQKEAM